MTLELPANKNTYNKKVSPFYQERIDGSFKSPLESMVTLIPRFNNPSLKRDELVSFIKTKRESEYWVAKFDESEVKALRKQFHEISRDRIVSQNV